jgi:hypothetical protein
MARAAKASKAVIGAVDRIAMFERKCGYVGIGCQIPARSALN